MIFAFSTLLLITNSCKKDGTSSGTFADGQELQKLSTWHKANLKSADENPFSNLRPRWKNVYVTEQPNQRVYEVPLDNPKKFFVMSRPIGKASMEQEERAHGIRLLIFEDRQTGKIQYGCYMSVENNGRDDAGLHYKNVGEFSGMVLFYSLKGTLANGWRYAQGKLVASIRGITRERHETLQLAAGGSRGKVMSSRDPHCTSYAMPRYQLGCITVMNNETCSYYFTGWDYTDICNYFDADDGLTPTGGSGGTYFPPVTDCHGEENGTATWNPNCGCIGGNTGITECPPKEIKNNVTDSCLKAQTIVALAAKTTIREMLNNTFGGTTKFEDLDLIIRDTTNLANNTDAEMQRLSGIEYEIRLNKNKLPNASKEYVVSTVYHEMLHAYMESKLVKGSDGRYIITDQHQQMATDYVILITGALQIAFPGLSNNEAWALSWGGLEKTPFYTTKLTAVQRTQITTLNDKHKNKSATDKLGTYCN